LVAATKEECSVYYNIFIRFRISDFVKKLNPKS
jgi:hypothetical protein